MNDKQLFRQKMQAELDEWQAEVDLLKAKASGASADAELEVNKQIAVLTAKIDEGKAKRDEISVTTDAAWESVKEGIDTSWSSMKSAFREAASKFLKR